jgi:hypothetical protein
MPLTTNTKVKQYLSITTSTDDTLITALCGYVQAFIESVCGITVGEAEVENEMHNGDDYGKILVLNKAPVTSIEKLESRSGIGGTDWAEENSNDFELIPGQGKVEFVYRLSGRQNIRVSYTAGMTSIPTDLEALATRLAAKEYNRRLSAGASQESLAEGSVSWSNLLDEDDKKIISRNKRITI